MSPIEGDRNASPSSVMPCTAIATRPTRAVCWWTDSSVRASPGRCDTRPAIARPMPTEAVMHINATTPDAREASHQPNSAGAGPGTPPPPGGGPDKGGAILISRGPVAGPAPPDANTPRPKLREPLGDQVGDVTLAGAAEVEAQPGRALDRARGVVDAHRLPAPVGVGSREPRGS